MSALTLMICIVLASPADPIEIDLRQTDRSLAKEPAYSAVDPLYGIVVFGPTAKTRVWMVLDKSDASKDIYDVLYADLNGNGDLTESGERFASESGTPLRTDFHLPDFTDPVDGAKHTEFRLMALRGEKPRFMASVKWRDKIKFGGGYAQSGRGGYMSFARSAQEAPIVWLNGDGPFRFQRWNSETLRIGYADDLKVFLGQQGVGKNSFASFAGFALPVGEVVLATLLYEDRNGDPHRLDTRLEKRC